MCELIDEEQLFMECQPILHLPTFMVSNAHVCSFGSEVKDVQGDDPIIPVLTLTALLFTNNRD